LTPLEEQVERALEAADELAAAIGSWREKGPPPQAKWDRLSDALASYLSARSFPLLPLEVTDESPLRVTVDTADLIELLYGATTDSPANRKARTRLRAALTQKGDNE